MQKHYYDLRYQVDETEWRARAKRNLVFQLWDRYKEKTPTQKAVLDYGCGTGVLQMEFEKKYPKTNASGIDVSKQTVDYCKKRGIKNVGVFDGVKIPYAHNNFDLVTAIDVFEHVKDDSVSFNEVKRVLKPKGLAIILVPAHQKLWSTRDVRLKHFRRYENGELEKKARQAGFEILASKNVDFALYFAFWIMHRLAPTKKGIKDLSRETAQTGSILNNVLLFYENLENKMQNFTTFPIGISKVIVARK